MHTPKIVTTTKTARAHALNRLPYATGMLCKLTITLALILVKHSIQYFCVCIQGLCVCWVENYVCDHPKYAMIVLWSRGQTKSLTIQQLVTSFNVGWAVRISVPHY